MLVNAIIHRDYMDKGSEIHVDMFDDRLEVFSPGGMVDGTFIQDKELNRLSSKRRNPIIADVFSRMDLMERRGSGLRKIVDSYTELEQFTKDLMPEFHSTETDFYVILKNMNYSGDKNSQLDNILQFARQNEYFRTKDIEELLHIGPSRARQLISELVREEQLMPLGQNRNRRYQLKNN